MDWTGYYPSIYNDKTRQDNVYYLIPYNDVGDKDTILKVLASTDVTRCSTVIVRVCYEYNIYASQVICVQDGNCPFITQLPPGRPGVAIRQNDNNMGGIR